MKPPPLVATAALALFAIATVATIWKLQTVTRERDELRKAQEAAQTQSREIQKHSEKASAEKAALQAKFEAEQAAALKKQEALEEYQRSLNLPLRPGTRLTDVTIRGHRFDELEVISVSSSSVSFRNQRAIVNAALGELPPELANRAILQEKAAPQYVPKNTPKAAPRPVAVRPEPERRSAGTDNDSGSNEYELARIKSAAAYHARNYFLNEYQQGSNSSVALRVSVNTEEPEARSGWDNEWRVCGRASFTNYNSIGWGSFSKDGRDFEVIIYWKNGTSKVKDFTLR